MRRLNEFLLFLLLASRFLRFILPWIGGIILSMLGLGVTAVAIFWRGVPGAVRTISDHWLDRAVAAGFPTQYDRALYYVLYAVAILMVVADWILVSYATVTVLRIIF